MLTIRTVLCPVDLTPATYRQVELAADLCRAFRARLILHHNVTHLSVGAAVGWMWRADHPVSVASAEDHVRTLARHVSDGVNVDAHITHGGPLMSVLALSEAVEADVVVLSTHGTADDDHPSVTERVIDDGKRAVLVLHEPREDAETLRFTEKSDPAQAVLVPTDHTRDSLPAVNYAFELARALPVSLYLLHVVPENGHHGDPTGALESLQALVPKDLDTRVATHIAHGDPANAIAATAERLHAACIVMGEHTRQPLRRWFTGDTSKGVLHQAPCPVWYVPARSASAARAAEVADSAAGGPERRHTAMT